MTPTARWPLHLRTFGDLVLERHSPDGTTETVYRSGKLLAVLLHLAVHGEVAVTRASIADLFWGDEAPERARASLRQAVASLHRLLGDDALVATRDTLLLRASALTTDLARAEAALAAGQVSALVAIYRGPFLHGDPRVGPEFDRWVTGERARWRRRFLEAVERGADEAMLRGAVDQVVRWAEAVRRVEPEADLWVRLLFDARVAQGRFHDARGALDDFERLLGGAGGEVPPALPPALTQRRERLARERDASRPVVPSADAASLSGVGTAFVGRTQLLDQLMVAAEHARLGGVELHVLSGPSGVGKSRLLGELESRWRLRGARVVRVRLLPAMREVPFSGLAECVRALLEFPGAAGVSEFAAAALVDFLPEVRDRYRGVAADVAVEDRARRRAEAFRELVQAVTERRFGALFIDDAQHLDRASLAALEGLVSLNGARFLLLASTRPPVTITAPAFTVHALNPFSPAEIRAVLETVAALPSAPWVEALLAELHQQSLGLPQRIVQLVRALEGTGVLRRDVEGWQTTGGVWPELMAGLTGAPSEPLAGRLPSDRWVLTVLRLWGRPMPEAMLLGIVALADATVPEAEWMEAVWRVEAAGLVTHSWTSWIIAHDSIGEWLDGQLAPAARAAALAATVHWVAAQPVVHGPVLEHIALLCGVSDAMDEAGRLVAAVAQQPSWRDRHGSARRLARQVARAAGQPSWEGPLVRRVGWWARQSRSALAWYSAMAAVLSIAFLVVVGLLWPRLRVEVEPLGESLWTPTPGGPAFDAVAPFYVQPRVSIVDGFGRRLPWVQGDVRVTGRGGRLVGDSVRRLVDGRVQYTSLGMLLGSGPMPVEDWRSPVRLRFHGPWFVVGTSVAVRGMVPGAVTRLALREVVVNDRPLDARWLATVPAGDTVRVRITFEYTTTGATANYVVAGAPSWLSPREGSTRIAGLPRPVVGAWQTVELRLPGRPTPGHGHLLIVLGGEDTADHVTSATNWAVGQPVWGDGNDLALVPEPEVQSLRRTGLLRVPRYLFASYDRPVGNSVIGTGAMRQQWLKMVPSYVERRLSGAAIEFEFTAPARTVAAGPRPGASSAPSGRPPR